MSDTEIRAMRYTIEQLSEKLHATEQYLRDIKKALDIAINVLNRVKDVKYEEYIDEKLEQIESITKAKEQQ